MLCCPTLASLCSSSGSVTFDYVSELSTEPLGVSQVFGDGFQQATKCEPRKICVGSDNVNFPDWHEAVRPPLFPQVDVWPSEGDLEPSGLSAFLGFCKDIA